MPVTRSRENLLDIEEATNVSFTVNLDDNENHTGARRKQPKTRDDNPRGGNKDNEFQVRQVISESLNVFRGEITNYISNEMRLMFQNMNVLNANRPQVDDNPITSPIPNVNGANSGTNGSSVRQALDSGHFNAEKVLNIIRNWRIKFCGYGNQTSVDEFIYRVNVLTSNTLNGDFEILCKHAHTLFEEKALAWYWRFHRQNDHFDWDTLTRALRTHYKADFNDYDVLDDIRRRRQKYNESFDEFYDIISAMTDKLRIPISDVDLCEILIRSLKPEIRHEILHLNIASVAELRREVRKHEKFMRDIHLLDQRKTSKGKIATVECCNNDTEVLDNSDCKNYVYSVQHTVKCWNCDQVGHTFHDCLDTKRVFCYGCGLRDTYRPKCPNCTMKLQGNGLMGVRRH